MIPARMFLNAYEERGLHSKNLARAVQTTGCIAINLVPWSVPAIFAQNILGVQAVDFIPYIIFAYFVVIINIIYGYTNISIEKIEKN